MQLIDIQQKNFEKKNDILIIKEKLNNIKTKNLNL